MYIVSTVVVLLITIFGDRFVLVAGKQNPCLFAIASNTGIINTIELSADDSTHAHRFDVTKTIDLDYDPTRKYLYWIDGTFKSIKKASFTTYNNHLEVENVITSNLSKPTRIAIDSNNSKIYWCDSSKDNIEMSSLDGTNRKQVISGNLKYISALAVSSEYLFWSHRDPLGSKIERSNLNGENRKTLIDTDITAPVGIALDEANSHLYWTDLQLEKIERTNMNGKERLIILSERSAYGIAVSGNRIYWTDDKTGNIEIITKKTEINESRQLVKGSFKILKSGWKFQSSK